MPAASCLCLFLALPCIGMQCVIVVFPDDTYLLFYGMQCQTSKMNILPSSRVKLSVLRFM